MKNSQFIIHNFLSNYHNVRNASLILAENQKRSIKIPGLTVSIANACLRFVCREQMTNESLRQRFAIDDKNYSMASQGLMYITVPIGTRIMRNKKLLYGLLEINVDEEPMTKEIIKKRIPPIIENNI